MAYALQTPPPATSFRFVMRKHPTCKHNPSIRNKCIGYDETVDTRDITHSDGVRSQTAFVNSPGLRERLWRQGWQDVTEMWEKANHPNGVVGQTDALTIARKALNAAERKGGVEVVKGDTDG